MDLPAGHNTYSFDGFLERLNRFDFYRDDPFFARALAHFVGEGFAGLDARLKAFSPKVSFRWRAVVERIARPELHPGVEHFDAHNHRTDRIMRPAEAERLEAEIFGEGLFAERTTPWERLAKRYLLHQLGEFGIMCPIACTEGLVALIAQFKAQAQPEVLKILEHCTEGGSEGYGIGAQFMSEIQGGSDIPANLLEAVPEGDRYRLYGTKFFCSAVHADYAVVTARVRGSRKIGAFVVPAWLPGDKPRGVRNGHVINRLKRKLGTAELPTAEVSYSGALAYAVGPTDQGVANTVGIVLTLSRLAVGIASAAAMTRAAREARMYSEFRQAFGKPICHYPLVNLQVRELVRAAQRTTAAACKIFRLYADLGCRLQAGLFGDEGPQMQLKRFALRELILIQKLVTAHEAVDAIRKSMSIFGGHGAIEDFSSLPRLYRDAAVNDLWEGPRNVLLMQASRDFARMLKAAAPFDVLATILDGAPPEVVGPLAAELADLANAAWHEGFDPRSLQRAAAWEDFVVRLFAAYQDQALTEVGAAPIVSPALSSLPEVWL